MLKKKRAGKDPLHLGPCAKQKPPDPAEETGKWRDPRVSGIRQPSSKSGWPSGLRRCVQVAVYFCRRGFESHFWQLVLFCMYDMRSPLAMSKCNFSWRPRTRPQVHFCKKCLDTFSLLMFILLFGNFSFKRKKKAAYGDVLRCVLEKKLARFVATQIGSKKNFIISRTIG